MEEKQFGHEAQFVETLSNSDPHYKTLVCGKGHVDGGSGVGFGFNNFRAKNICHPSLEAMDEI